MTRQRLRWLAHLLTVLLVDALALTMLSEALPGFVLDGPLVALGSAATIGLSNALIWPVIARFTIRLSVLTLGLASLMLNSALVGIAIAVVPGAHMEGPAEALVVTFLITVLTALISAVLAIDQDDTWYFQVVRRQARRQGIAQRSERPGLLFLEIDGLAHDILRRAVSNGHVPNLARWLREGSHHLQTWETDWSSQTGACQAGILHGNNKEMPAFRWWDKERGVPTVTNHPRDAAEIEERQSDGKGLLHADGASRANILSGDAVHSSLTMSTVLLRGRGRMGSSYTAYFARPYAAFRTLLLSLTEIIAERRAAARQRRDEVWPRIDRSRVYAVMRAWATVVQLDLQVATVVRDLLAGRPAIYTTFLAYDEVAHHSGIERADTMAVLRRVDRQIGRIVSAIPAAPRPYEVVVLSDHGQSQGATFFQRYGKTLEEVVREATHAEAVHVDAEGEDDAQAFLRAGFAEGKGEESAAGRVLLAASRQYREREGSPLNLAPPEVLPAATDEELPEVSVMASGCLGLISFPRRPGRVSAEAIEALYPGLLTHLVAHPGIGFLMLDSEEHGPIALGDGGMRLLEPDQVRGDDPLKPFGPNAARHLLRTHAFSNCPDILINSSYWPELDEVAAFEELVGSHGGLGGMQCHPFVLYPAHLEWPAEPVIGAESIYSIFSGWLDQCNSID